MRCWGWAVFVDRWALFVFAVVWSLTISVRKIDYRFYNPEGMALL
jgi:hypothetical protein